MSIKMVLFDLDGTLLPMDQDEFVKCYFGALCKKLAPYGYEPSGLVDTIWRGTAAMVKNTGEKVNRERFWDVFTQVYGEDSRSDEARLDDFYENDFDIQVRESCGYDPEAAAAVEQIKSMGYRVALATNPIFPTCATESRIKWAGLRRDMFELVTTYDNSKYCKPNLDYYRDITEKLGVSGEECLMVGNDVGEDMIAQALGMKVFLMTEYMINKKNVDISAYPRGGFSELIEYVRALG